MTEGDSFGQFLKRLRESKELTLRQAAQAAGVSSGYLSQVEGGKRGKRKGGEHFAPHPQILKKLAETYHVPPQELFERAGFFEKEEDYLGFSEEKETNRCFDFMIHDPVFKQVLTTMDKRAIIDRYETLTGRKLITWAGEYSVMAKKPEYKGLKLSGGALYAETVQTTLSLQEVAQELGIDVEDVRELIEHDHLRPIKSTKGPPVVEKSEISQLKSYALSEGLKLLSVRDRKHRPHTFKDYEQGLAEITAKEHEEVKKEIAQRKKISEKRRR